MKTIPFEKIKFKLKKFFNQSDKKYIYKLIMCCPTIVNLNNSCPGIPLALKIHKHLNLNGTKLEVYGCDVDICYKNIGVCHSRNPIAINKDCPLYYIKTSNVSVQNTIFVSKFSIPVKVVSLKSHYTRVCVELGDFGKFVCCNYKECEEEDEDDCKDECEIKRYLVGQIQEDGKEFVPYVDFCDKQLIVEADENGWLYKDEDDCVDCP
jgi:hypothetical protein